MANKKTTRSKQFSLYNGMQKKNIEKRLTSRLHEKQTIKQQEANNFFFTMLRKQTKT